MMGMSAQFTQHSASVPHLGWGVRDSDGLCGKWGGGVSAAWTMGDAWHVVWPTLRPHSVGVIHAV